jgi:hypothetical protein
MDVWGAADQYVAESGATWGLATASPKVQSGKQFYLSFIPFIVCFVKFLIQAYGFFVHSYLICKKYVPAWGTAL